MSPTAKPDGPATGPWHLDKRVPLAMLLAMAAQFVGFVVAGSYYAGRFDVRLSAVEASQADNKDVAADLAVLKSQMTDVKDILGRMENRLVEREQK